MPASNPIALKNKFVLSILLFAISGGKFFDAITLSITCSLSPKSVTTEVEEERMGGGYTDTP